jgi:aspartyl-tRNA(Asn)/glutamyl-tRNA(Gln) amidotransferase subunit A
MLRIRDWSELDPSARRRRRARAREHAAAINLVTNAFIEITPAIDSDMSGPMGGLPYAAKDLFRTPGREPGCGLGPGVVSGIQGFSDLLDRLADTGADLVGYTNMTELAYEPSGVNASTGHVHNPWNLDFIPGGSSSGSAAAVASGVVVAALGSDTGGSLRIPAHACGVTAWKPSYGLLSMQGAMPLAPTLDTVGILTRSASDLLLMAPFMGPGCATEALRRAVVPDDMAAECDPEIRRCLADAVAAIEAAGVSIEHRPALHLLEEIDHHALIVMQGESARRHQSRLADDVLTPILRKRLGKGLDIDDDTLAACVAARHRLVQQFEEHVLANSDIAVLPVMPITTPTLARCDPASDSFTGRTLYALSRWTRFVNMLGFPAVAMPAGFDHNGMPVGVQIIGRTGSDFALLELVRNVQNMTNWHARMPDAVLHLFPKSEALA